MCQIHPEVGIQTPSKVQGQNSVEMTFSDIFLQQPKMATLQFPRQMFRRDILESFSREILGDACVRLRVSAIGAKRDLASRITNKIKDYVGIAIPHEYNVGLQQISEADRLSPETFLAYVNVIVRMTGGTDTAGIPGAGIPAVSAAVVHIPFTSAQFIPWLLLNHRVVRFDKARLLKDGAAGKINLLQYGQWDLKQVYPYFTLTLSQISEITKRRPVNFPITGCPLTQQHYTDVSKAMAGLFFPNTPNAIPFPVLPGGARNTKLDYDSGREDVPSAGGMPRVTIQWGQHVFETIPFGIMPTSWGDCVTLYDGIPAGQVQEFLSEMKMTSSTDLEVPGRNLAYLISTRDDIEVKVSPSCTGQYDYSLGEIFGLIENLPKISMTLLGAADCHAFIDHLNRVVPPFTLTPGRRQGLFLHIYKNKDLYAHIRNPKTGKLPFCIEDYYTGPIPPDLLNFVVPRDINPYALMSRTQLERIAAEHDHDAPSDPEELRNYDEALPDWKERVNTEVSDLFSGKQLRYHMSGLHLLYAAACIGIRVADFPQISETVLKTYYELKCAGGISATSVDAHALPVYVIKALPVTTRQDRELLFQLLGADMASFLTEENMSEILRRGYLNPLPIKPDYQTRAHVWSTLSQAQKEIFAQVYRSQAPNAARSFIMAEEKFPLFEQFVQYFDTTKEGRMEDIAQRMQCVAPPNVALSLYVIESLPKFALPVSRRTPFVYSGVQDLELMTDQEIYAQCGGFFGHTSRDDLVAKANQFLQGTSMFFLAFPGTSGKRTPANDASWQAEDLTVPDSFAVYYGLKDRYYGYAIEDISQGFQETSDGADESVRALTLITQPAGVKVALPVNQVTQLKVLLEGLKTTKYLPIPGEEKAIQERQAKLKEIDDCLHEINEAELYVTTLTDEDKVLRRRYNTFAPELRDEIVDILQSCFILGMNFRNWKGRGHPFPMADKDTHDDVLSLDTKLELCITFYNKLREAKSRDVETFVNQLPIVERRGDREARGRMPLRDFVDNIVGVEMVAQHERDRRAGQILRFDDHDGPATRCIRMGSATFTGTGYYYLKMFSALPQWIADGYDPARIAAIS